METLEHLVNKDVQKITHTTTLREAAQMMREKKVGSLLVEKDDRYIGIITEADLVRKAAAAAMDFKKDTVETVMSSPIVTISIQQTPQDASHLMKDRETRHLAVTDRGKIVGVLSVRDLLVHFQKQSEPQMGID